MILKFYKCNDDPLVINKTLGSVVATLSDVTIKDSTNIINPVFILRYNSNIFSANYLHSDDFSRYYFIENIVVEQQRIFVYCKVDVLYTYRTDILKTTCYVERQSKYSEDDDTVANRFLPDGQVPIETRPNLYLAGDNVEQKINWSRVTSDKDGDFVMLIGGGKLPNVGGE